MLYSILYYTIFYSILLYIILYDMILYSMISFLGSQATSIQEDQLQMLNSNGFQQRSKVLKGEGVGSAVRVLQEQVAVVTVQRPLRQSFLPL